MRNSHLPFTVSARRLAALHATLAEWTRALEPHESPTLSSLCDVLRLAGLKTIHSFVAIQPYESKRRDVAILLLHGEVSIDHASNYTGCPRRTAQTYLASFVAEGWVRRVKPGVYALKIP